MGVAGYGFVVRRLSVSIFCRLLNVSQLRLRYLQLATSEAVSGASDTDIVIQGKASDDSGVARCLCEGKAARQSQYGAVQNAEHYLSRV